MTEETPKERKKRVNLIFENIGEAMVQAEVISPAAGLLFNLGSSSEPTRDEAEKWLKTRSRNRKILMVVSIVGTLAAILAAVFSVLGYFSEPVR